MSSRSRSAELSALTSIAAQVNCTHDLSEILVGALQTTLDVVGADAGEVFLVNGESGQLTLRAHRGLTDGFIADEAVIGPGDCVCGLSAESGQVAVVKDIASDPACRRAGCRRDGFRSLISLPLRARGDILGLLNLHSRDADRFSADDEELVTAIGNQIGIALANARLIDDAEQQRVTLDRVMNSLVDGLILVDRRGKIAFANLCAEQMLGLPVQSLLGETPEAVDRHIAGQLAEAEPIRSPLSTTIAQTPADLRDPAQSPGAEFSLALPVRRIVQARPFPIHSSGGESLGVGVVLRDITREKELDAMKSQLLSTVSHELRTPLASIKGFATTLLRPDVEWEPSTRREFLTIIDQEADRLSELIGSLLDMARVESGRLGVDMEPTDLGPIVEETVTRFQVLTHIHHFVVRVPPSLPPVWADRRRIRQVLGNLVENAVKYSPAGGPITVATEALPGSVEVSVADKGLGIPAEHVNRVFDRFYQVDSASTRRAGGTGLGLSICKAIVEAHGGQIWVESRFGAGSTFRFTLQQANGQDGPSHAEGVAAQQG